MFCSSMRAGRSMIICCGVPYRVVHLPASKHRVIMAAPSLHIYSCCSFLSTAVLKSRTRPPIYSLCSYTNLSPKNQSTIPAHASLLHANACQCCYYSTSSQGSPQEESLIRRGLTKIGTAVKTFMLGTKALYKDVRHMHSVRSKQGKFTLSYKAPQADSQGKVDFPLSREQLVFSYSTRKDLIRMIPTVALFFIPFIGYFVPLIAFMYPRTLLSHHFWTANQKVTFTSLRSRKSTIHFRNLMGEVRLRATEEQLDLLSAIGRQLIGSSSESDWTDVHSLVKESIFLPFEMKRLPVEHTSLLCKGWNLGVWIPLETVRHWAIEKHMYYIFTCDQLIALEGGVDKLTDKELFNACVERNLLGVDAEDTTDLKRKLNTWVALSTGFKECPVSLLVHLPMTQYLSNIRT